MDGIEGSNRFDGKGPNGARKHGLSDGDDVAATLERLQPTKRCALVGRGQPCCHSSADEGAGSLRERQSRRDAPSRSTQCVPGGDVLLKRSEEHTSELQSPCNLVCRLLLEKKKKT